MRNIELKARLRDLEAARRVAAAVATEYVGIQLQTDTYFVCPQGRLKLREIEGAVAQLVWYARSDQPGPKASDYQLVTIPDAGGLKAALTAAWGVWTVVRKRREIYLHHNVRIHLDEVDGLGQFLEFEAVLSDVVDDAQGHVQLRQLSEQFGLRPEDLLEGSYSDMNV